MFGGNGNSSLTICHFRQLNSWTEAKASCHLILTPKETVLVFCFILPWNKALSCGNLEVNRWSCAEIPKVQPGGLIWDRISSGDLTGATLGLTGASGCLGCAFAFTKGLSKSRLEGSPPPPAPTGSSWLSLALLLEGSPPTSTHCRLLT